MASTSTGNVLPATEEPIDLGHTLAAAEAELHTRFDRHVNAAIDPASTAFLLMQVQEVLLRSETAQRQAAEFQAAIFNALPAHVALIDPGGKVLAVNEAWRRFAAANGLPDAGAGLGSNYLETTDRAARDGSVEARAAAQGIRQVLAGELKEFTLEYPCDSPAEKRWFQLMATPLHENRRDGAVVMHIEVTQRKQAEERIREQAALLDQAQDAIAACDLEHRISYWNHGAERLYGWTAAEAVGRNALELLFKAGSSELEEALRVLGKPDWTGEARQVTKAGKEIIVQNRWTLVRDGKGEPKSMLLIGTDVTERKKLQAQFLRAQRLESIGSLASGIAHDLNNILAPMLMSVNLLQEVITDGPNAKLLDTLRFSAQRGAEMVKQILSFTRGQEGLRGPVNLKELANEVARIARETFPKTIQVQTCSCKEPWPIEADSTQIHQVLMNLCVNARDAMPRGGRLRLEVENLLLGEDYASTHREGRPGPYVVVTVGDTGTGIPPEILDKIFDPFFSTKGLEEGTGLGLSTVLGIVKGHLGFIHTYSEVGKGTRFKVYLPAAAAADNPRPVEPPAEPPLGHGERVLLVDDEQAVQEITRAILIKYGYQVFSASDGTEALALFAQHQHEIDIVLTDFMMPFLDGPATIRALQSIAPGVRIITTSGLQENEAVAQQFRHVTFLAKPFTPEKLLTTIAAVLEGPANPSPSAHAEDPGH